MANKFPTAKTYSAERVTKTRTAIFEDGVYILMLRPEEAKTWLYRARLNTVKHAADEAAITIRRIEIALKYLAARKLRASAIFAASQMSMF